MAQRDSFVFYRSFYEAVSYLNKADRATVLLAVCDYALNGVEQELKGAPAAVFALMKPNIDANQKRYENGKRGGRPGTGGRPKGGKSEIEAKPNDNQNETKPEPNVDVDEDGDVDANGDEDVNAVSDPVAAVISAYANKINSCPSETCIGELKGFVGQMGAECCLRAMNIALDEKKTSWSYIRAILQSKLRQGVRCLADWDELEEGRKRNGAVEHQSAASSAGGNGAKWNIRSALDDDD